MKRFEYRIQGTERVLHEVDEFYMNAPLIDREFLYRNTKDKTSKYEVYDSLLGKIVYKEGDEKKYPTVTLTKEQQEMILDTIFLENAAEVFEDLSYFTEKREDINEEVRDHIKKGYWRNKKKCEREDREKWLEFESSFGGIKNVNF